MKKGEVKVEGAVLRSDQDLSKEWNSNRLLTYNTVEEARLKGSKQGWSQTWSSRALSGALYTPSPSVLPKHPALSPHATFTPIAQQPLLQFKIY